MEKLQVQLSFVGLFQIKTFQLQNFSRLSLDIQSRGVKGNSVSGIFLMFLVSAYDSEMERKEAVWKEVLGVKEKILKKDGQNLLRRRCFKGIYIYNKIKKKLKKQFRNKMNQDVSGKRKCFRRK